MRKYLPLIALVVALSIALSACQPLPKVKELTCVELLATPLQSYIGQAVAAETFAEAVEKAYGVPRQGININMHEDGGWFLNWTQNGLGYGVSSENGTTLDRIGIDYKPGAVTTRRILDCIGSQPEWYRAAYGPHAPTTGIRWAFDLYFPAQGIVATGTGYDQHRESPPPLRADFPLEHMFISEPSSLSALYKQRWGNSLEETRPALQPMPWPGDWGAVHFIEDHGMGW